MAAILACAVEGKVPAITIFILVSFTHGSRLRANPIDCGDVPHLLEVLAGLDLLGGESNSGHGPKQARSSVRVLVQAVAGTAIWSIV